MPKKHYSHSFGIEWKSYSDVQLDSKKKYSWDISNSRLELVLGLPLEYIKGKSVLELGAGPGRFSEILAKYASKLHLIDASDAIYSNIAKNEDNVTFEKIDFNSKKCILRNRAKFDIVYCRGVIQHTKSPSKSIKNLFKYSKKNGIVIFDVYPRKKPMLWYKLTNFKYFWRLVLPKLMTVEDFDQFLKCNLIRVYSCYKINRAIRSNAITKALCKLVPFFNILFAPDLLKDHPGIKSEIDKARLVCSLLIDGIYARYDQPMTITEINNILSEIGKKYYSVDRERCIVRSKNDGRNKPLKYIENKNGIFLY